MKFRFPFHNVMKHRKTLEDIAQREFQTAYAHFLEVTHQLEKLHEQVRVARNDAYGFQTTGGRAGPALSQVHEFLKNQDIRIEQQQKKVQECEKQVENYREILKQKAIDYKIIESLKGKMLNEFKAEKKKKELKETDDLAIMRAGIKYK